MSITAETRASAKGPGRIFFGWWTVLASGVLALWGFGYTASGFSALFKPIASELGFSLSALINGYLNQLIRNKAIYFSAIREVPNEYMVQALRESEEDRKNKRFKSFSSVDESLKFVDNIIGDKKN